MLLEDGATNFVALMHIPAHVVETHCTAHVAFEREHVERAVWFGEGRFNRLIRPIAMRDLGNDGDLLGGRTPGHRSRFARMGIRVVHAIGVYPVEKRLRVREALLLA